MRRPTSYGEKLFQISKQRLDQNIGNKKKPVTPKKTLKGPKVTDSMKEQEWAESIKKNSRGSRAHGSKEVDFKLPQINSQSNLQRKIVRDKVIAANHTSSNSKRTSFN